MWTAFNAAAKNATRIASGVIEQLQDDDEYEVGCKQVHSMPHATIVFDAD
jgi:hypothetical protein